MQIYGRNFYAGFLIYIFYFKPPRHTVRYLYTLEADAMLS